MAQTPQSSATAYCTATQFFTFYDYRLVADLVRDNNGQAPTRAALLDSDDQGGATVASALLAASGLLEAAVTQGNRYLAADLGALTGASQAHLQRVVAGLAIQLILDRRPTASLKPDLLSAVKEANRMLDALRTGENVFGLAETQTAAQRMDGLRWANADPQVVANSVVTSASRYFGNRNPRG